MLQNNLAYIELNIMYLHLGFFARGVRGAGVRIQPRLLHRVHGSRGHLKHHLLHGCRFDRLVFHHREEGRTSGSKLDRRSDGHRSDVRSRRCSVRSPRRAGDQTGPI